MRPAAVLGGGVLVAAALGVAVVTGVLPSPAAGSPAPSTSPGAADPEVRTAPVERRTMQTAAELDGTLGYEEARDVQAGIDGVLTRRPAVGTVIRRNGVLYELDGRVRPRLFYGTRPMWRELRPGITDGADILQLERNLRALGYAPKGMKVNRHWDAKTTRAVKRWQKGTGRTRDGSLDGGDIAFLPGAIRVSAHPAEIGTRVGPGTPVLGTTGATRVVTLEVAASRLDLLPDGAPVTVTLPDETRVAGTVSRVGREVSAGQDGGSSTVTVTIALDPDAGLPDLDAAPVTVDVVTTSREGVLAVPVTALVALLEGGFAVEVVADDGSRRYAGVETGLFQDGFVEVTGEGLEPGMAVVVAR